LAFLQQNGYGEQAITAAQSKFPAAPQQPTSANTSTSTTATPTTPQTPEQIRQAKQAAAAQTAQDQIGPPGQPVAQPTTAPAPTALGAVGNVRPGTPQPDPKAQQAALKARLQSGNTLSSRTSGKFKDSEVGAQRNKLITKPDRSTQMVPVREGVELNKQQLSDIFTAVAQTGATPQQSADNTGNSAGNSTVGLDGNDTSPGTPANAAPTGSTAPTGKSSQMPNRLTPEDILQYYARLTSPYERNQVKKGIPEVDKQLSQGAQQAKQQPTK